MLRSMTGFGKAVCEYEGELIAAEVSAVNHRFLDCMVRLPSVWSALEPVVKETVRKDLSRGRVNVFVSRKRGETSRQAVMLDAGIAEQYVNASRQLAELLGTDQKLDLNVLAQLDGVFRQEEPEEDLEAVQGVLVKALSEALKNLDTMRATEGKALAEELAFRVEQMREALALVEERLPQLDEEYKERLRQRIAELTADVNLAEDRIALEVALMADKCDVTEEAVRLKTHLDHMVEYLSADGPVGRDLNFLAQEMHREVNTLGSKLRDGAVAKEVLRMKSEVERIREQVQNIE